MARDELADGRRTQEAVTDERKPYEAPEVRDVPPEQCCPSCSAPLVDGATHPEPVCDYWRELLPNQRP